MKALCVSSVFFLLLFPGSAQASEQTVYPSGASDQAVINQALESAYQAGGGTVYLSAGIYNIDGQVKIGSNTKLTGSPDAILRVYSGSNQWFTDGIGIIGELDTHLSNVEIDSFQIDGNLRALPSSYANSGAGDHNAERAIDFRCDSGNFGNNISIHDMKIYDCFSDGIHIAFANNVNCYNNFVSDCQHSGIYFVSVINGLMDSNKVAGITSDCLRLDNCVNNIFCYNTLYSFTGDSGGAYKGGQNGVQIADQGFSHGGGSAKPTSTANIEGYGNVFSNDGLRTIWLDSTGKGVKNVYLHNNTGTSISTNGVSVGNISFTNPPTVQQSEQIFSSIFDILKQDFSFRYLDIQVPINASVSVTEYNNSYNPYSLICVTGEGLSGVKYAYAGKSTTHYFLINNNNNADLWTGDIPNRGNCLYIQGQFDRSKLTVTCFTPSGYQKITNFNVTEITDNSNQILSPNLWAFVGTLTILGISIYRNFRRVITKW